MTRARRRWSAATRLAAVVLGGLAAAPASARAESDDDGPVRVSLPTESDREAWASPGFRLQLGALYGGLVGIGGAPGGRLRGPVLRTGVRLDRDWSLLGSLHYTAASGSLSGLRYAGTVEPTLHLTPQIALALGLGFGGIVEGPNDERTGPEPPLGSMGGSYTFPDASVPFERCTGTGVTALARLEWSLVLGPRSSTALGVELLGQWTGCVDDTGRVEPDSAQPIVRRQFWPHLGASLTWTVGWR